MNIDPNRCTGLECAYLAEVQDRARSIKLDRMPVELVVQATTFAFYRGWLIDAEFDLEEYLRGIESRIA